MKAAQVHLNGKKVCTAGFIPDSGLLAGIMAFDRRHGQSAEAEAEEEKRCAEMRLRVSGIRCTDGKKSSVNWFDRALKAGDKIVIKIVEVDEDDPPAKITPWHESDDQRPGTEI